jgi:hypothetical protein
MRLGHDDGLQEDEGVAGGSTKLGRIFTLFSRRTFIMSLFKRRL